MVSSLRALFVVLFFGSSASAELDFFYSAGMEKRTLPEEASVRFGAYCLNPSNPPYYYIRRNATSPNYVLFLEGGGWCFGTTFNSAKSSCAKRGGFSVSNNGGATTRNDDYGGILGQNPRTNPDFFTWNAVFIHYCDGSSFGGGRLNPEYVLTNDGDPALMYLRGRNIFDAVVADLNSNMGMQNASEVILSGGSAGGLATLYNLDHLATLLPPGTSVVGFPDAGFFLDAEDASTGEFKFRDKLRGGDLLWNVTGGGGTNKRCLEHYRGGETWRCLMAEYIVPFLKTPVYIMNSIYDSYSLPNIVNLRGCAPPTRSGCNADTKAETAAYGKRFRAALRNATVAKSATDAGYFVDSCYVHEQNVNYCSTQSSPNCVGWHPDESGSRKWGYSTAVNGLTPQEAFSRWYFGRSSTRGGGDDEDDEFRLVDGCPISENPSCVYPGYPVTPRYEDTFGELLVGTNAVWNAALDPSRAIILPDAVASAADCLELCRADARCGAFTWHSSNVAPDPPNDWRLKCVLRVDGVWEPHDDDGEHVSARRHLESTCPTAA